MLWGASITALARLRVEGSEEWMLEAGGLEVGDEVPEGSCLVVVAYGRHVHLENGIFLINGSLVKI